MIWWCEKSLLRGGQQHSHHHDEEGDDVEIMMKIALVLVLFGHVWKRDSVVSRHVMPTIATYFYFVHFFAVSKLEQIHVPTYPLLTLPFRSYVLTFPVLASSAKFAFERDVIFNTECRYDRKKNLITLYKSGTQTKGHPVHHRTSFLSSLLS